MKRYIEFSTMNTRDLGGYPAMDGKYTRSGVLLRSDAPLKTDEKGVAHLKAMGITTAMDLRHSEEIGRNPSVLGSAEGIRYVNVPLELGSSRGLADPSEVAAHYTWTLIHMPESIAAAMRTIAYAEGGVIYNCTAGKDRTGIISAMVLSLCGVSRADIVANYQVSYTYLVDFIRRVCEQHPDMPAFVGRSEPIYIEGFLDDVDRLYGGVEAYLISIGITQDEMDLIRSKLL